MLVRQFWVRNLVALNRFTMVGTIAVPTTLTLLVYEQEGPSEYLSFFIMQCFALLSITVFHFFG